MSSREHGIESDFEISFTASIALRMIRCCFSISLTGEIPMASLSARMYVRVMVGNIRKIAG